MTSEHIYIKTRYPDQSSHILSRGKYENSISSFSTPFIANKCKGNAPESDFNYVSPHGGHQMSINKQYQSQIFGNWTTDSAYSSSSCVRNEYNIFGHQGTNYGPSPGRVESDKLFSCYPTFHGYGYFNNQKNSHGFGYSLVDTKGGCPSDVAGVSFNVYNFGNGNNIVVRDQNNETKEVKVANDQYAYDWQFNMFWGIYRAKQGHYFSIPFYPNGDNFGDDASKNDPDTMAYVFRNSNALEGGASQALGSNSFLSKGTYNTRRKGFRLDLITDHNTATPRNALFCGIEFTTWWGTEGGAGHSRTFQINNLCVIPDLVANKIRGKHPINTGYHVIPPEYMRFDDFASGSNYKINTWKSGYKGISRLY